MVKLRHIAILVPDLQKAEKFYEEMCNMQRLRESKVAVNLSDGDMIAYGSLCDKPSPSPCLRNHTL